MPIIVLSLFWSLQAMAFLVVLDPGHGGKFTGAYGLHGAIEKNLTLEITLKIAQILEKNGLQVVLTRSTDTQLDDNRLKDLQARVEMSKKEHADAFVSIHLNKSTYSSKTRGFEVYVPYSPTFDEKSYHLASSIHHELSQKRPASWQGSMGNLNKYDRGVRAARFTVLLHHVCPAALVELDFMSNPDVAFEIKTTKYKEDLAAIVAQGIINYERRSRTP